MRRLLEDVLDVRAHVYSKSQLGRVQILSHFSKKDTYRHLQSRCALSSWYIEG
jgi:hypothetical protein